MSKGITFVRGDDWEALYVDGKRVAQDNSLTADAVLFHLGIDHTILYANQEWLEEEGRLPRSLEDVMLEIE